MGITTTKRIAKNHTPSRVRVRPDPGADHIPARDRLPAPDHVPHQDHLALSHDPGREHHQDHDRDLVPRLQDTLPRTTMTRAVRESRKRPATDREHPPRRLARKNLNTTRARAQPRPSHHQSTRRVKRNMTAAGKIVTIVMSMEANGIAPRKTIGNEIGIGIETEVEITTVIEIVTKVAMIGMTTGRIIAATMATGISGTNIVAVAVVGTATMTGIDRRSTGIEIGTETAGDNCGVKSHKFY